MFPTVGFPLAWHLTGVSFKSQFIFVASPRPIGPVMGISRILILQPVVGCENGHQAAHFGSAFCEGTLFVRLV